MTWPLESSAPPTHPPELQPTGISPLSKQEEAHFHFPEKNQLMWLCEVCPWKGTPPLPGSLEETWALAIAKSWWCIPDDFIPKWKWAPSFGLSEVSEKEQLGKHEEERPCFPFWIKWQNHYSDPGIKSFSTALIMIAKDSQEKNEKLPVVFFSGAHERGL